MSLTGTGIQIGTASDFGASIRYPRGLASDGTTVWLFDANRGYTLDPTTGVATAVAAAVTNFGSNENQIRSATYHNSQVLVFGRRNERIQVFNTTDGTLSNWHTNIVSYAGSETGRPDLWGITSLNGTLHALDRQQDALFRVSDSGVLTRVGNSTNFGINAMNAQGFTAYRGMLIAVDTGLDKIFSMDPTTGEGTIIGAANTLPDTGPEALVEFDRKLLMAGSENDALFRLYDVLWDEAIDAIEVDEGGNGSLDLSGVSQDATSFEFAPSNTSRSWLTVSGDHDLVITNAPDVTADTDFEAVVRAVRDSAYEDKTLTVRVGDAAPPPPVTPPTFTAPSTNYEVNERADDSIDSTEFFTGHTRLTFRSGYSAPSWLTISGLNVVITDAPDVLEDTDFTVPLTATNSDGSVNGSLTISVQQIDPAPVFTTPVSVGRGTPVSGIQRTEMPPVIVPDAPTGLKVNLKPTSAVIRWAAVDGIDGYEVSYAEGASPGTTWIATGSTGTRFFVRDLKRGTQYTFGVRGRNSAGAGAGSRPVTQNTPIASLHNALFFKEYVNSGNRVTVHGSPTDIVRAAVDNDYRTFSNATDYAIDMSRNNQPTRVDAVFIKSKGVTRHSGTPTGGSGTGWTNEALPATVKNWEGTHISTTVLGFQHHLLLMDQHFTATSVRVQFEGTNVEVYEILLLELLLEIDANGDFVEINPDYVDRSGVIHTSPGGEISRSSALGGARHKWETNYVVKIVPGKTLLESVDEFVYQMGENPNIVHAQEPSRHPARVHPASFLLKRVPTRLRSDDKLQGDAVQFRVGEQ